MEITLLIDKQEKKFSISSFISARMLRKAFGLQKKLSNAESEEDLDVLIDYVVDVFGNQFTRDQFYDGLHAHKVLPTIVELLSFVNGATGDSNPNQ